MFFLEDDVRILCNSGIKKVYAIKQELGKIYEIQWPVFTFLYYVTENNMPLEKIHIKNKDKIIFSIEYLLGKGILMNYNNGNKANYVGDRKLSSTFEYYKKLILFNIFYSLYIKLSSTEYRSAFCFTVEQRVSYIPRFFF